MSVWVILLIISLIITALDFILLFAISAVVIQKYKKKHHGLRPTSSLAEGIIGLVKIIILCVVPVLNIIMLVPLIFNTESVIKEVYEIIVSKEEERSRESE